MTKEDTVQVALGTKAIYTIHIRYSRGRDTFHHFSDLSTFKITSVIDVVQYDETLLRKIVYSIDKMYIPLIRAYMTVKQRETIYYTISIPPDHLYYRWFSRQEILYKADLA